MGDGDGEFGGGVGKPDFLMRRERAASWFIVLAFCLLVKRDTILPGKRGEEESQVLTLPSLPLPHFP